ncbi:MAG TPA: RNA polymerase sigma-54 factor, partial [Candidatus Edwardsbacteria bacterium]|nr:RNA polymerase sigma-54 factor [Candidatus Edwardsbacteria bacterium]
RGENPKKPLTDQQIVDILAKGGIHIARRTVAKYRMEDKILPVKLRRKL